MSRKYMQLYVAKFQFQYSNRFNHDMFGAALVDVGIAASSNK
jgi:hypothetical protein